MSWNSLSVSTPTFGQAITVLRNGLQYNAGDLFKLKSPAWITKTPP